MAATVAQIVEDLGPALIVGTAGDLSVEFERVDVTDPVYPNRTGRAALLVAPGYRVDEDRFARLLEEAEANGAAGVVVKAGSAPGQTGGLAVVCIEPAADWGQVITLLRTAANVASHPEESLFGLADALSSLCGGPVVLHDPAWQLIAYSGDQILDPVRRDTILGRRAPADALDGLRKVGALGRLDKGEVIDVSDGDVPGLGRRMAVAVRAGSEQLATIWLQIDGDRDADALVPTLRQAADVAALTLLRVAAAGPEGMLAGDAALGSLLAGARTERLVSERMGVAVDHGFVMAGMRPTTSDDTERAAAARRLASLARSYCSAYRIDAQIAAPVDTTYVLFAARDSAQRHGSVRVLTDMHTRLQPSAPHRAVVSSRFGVLGETAGVRHDVDDLLALAERRGWSDLTDSDRLQATLRLEHFREVALAHPDLLSGPVMRLAEHDRAHNSELVATLKAYFETVADTKETARRLELHVNTVRYRIAKAQEIAEFSLNDPDERLLVELQVRLLT